MADVEPPPVLPVDWVDWQGDVRPPWETPPPRGHLDGLFHHDRTIDAGLALVAVGIIALLLGWRW